MRILKFIVENQKIKQDPSCDFSGLVAGTEGYLKAEFVFSKEWDGFLKVAAFWSLGRECPPQILKDGKTCLIPTEALKWTDFEVGVVGKTKDCKIKTDKVRVVQERGA